MPPLSYAPAPRGVDDDDLGYVWSPGGIDIPVPRWLAEAADVPWMLRLTIFFVGLCSGLGIAALALLIGFYAAMG